MERLLFVVSDLHLGGAPGGNDHPGFQICTAAGGARLAAFIEFVTSQRGTHQDIHLVLAGDLVDFLAEEDFAAFTGRKKWTGYLTGRHCPSSRPSWIYGYIFRDELIGAKMRVSGAGGLLTAGPSLG